ncbi:MAG TPA: hypothetical protein VH352_19290, partial [Pseudonocardiaceae bacterium]|nr:hypothetical protein [Pseudonocardiaceae bacterium]
PVVSGEPMVGGGFAGDVSVSRVASGEPVVRGDVPMTGSVGRVGSADAVVRGGGLPVAVSSVAQVVSGVAPVSRVVSDEPSGSGVAPLVGLVSSEPIVHGAAPVSEVDSGESPAVGAVPGESFARAGDVSVSRVVQAEPLTRGAESPDAPPVAVVSSGAVSITAPLVGAVAGAPTARGGDVSVARAVTGGLAVPSRAVPADLSAVGVVSGGPLVPGGVSGGAPLAGMVSGGPMPVSRAAVADVLGEAPPGRTATLLGEPILHGGEMPVGSVAVLGAMRTVLSGSAPARTPSADAGHLVTAARSIDVTTAHQPFAPLPSREPPPAVQREPEPTAVPAAPVPVSTVEPAPTPSASVPAAPAEKELDQVAQELFGPLLRRLKAELQLDRERRGALIDLWH